MQITVLGVGKVGLPLAVHLAELGHQIQAYDVSQLLRQQLQAKVNPIPFEPGIDLHAFTVANSLEEALKQTEAIFLIVPTPTDGETLSGKFVDQALNELEEKLTTDTLTVCISTLDPRTIEEVLRPRKHLKIVYNPTMIRLGHVKEDLQHGRVFLFGGEKELCQKVESIWQLNKDQTTSVFSDFKSIAMAKLTINVSLGYRVALANEIAAKCDVLKVKDHNAVFQALYSDGRLGGAQYLRPGSSVGGPCLPRDLTTFASIGQDLFLAKATDQWHKEVFKRSVDKAMNKLKHYRRVAILGICYNPGSFDLTNSVGLEVARQLSNRLESWGSTVARSVKVYDPAAQYLLNLDDESFKVSDSLEEAIDGVQIALVSCKWPEIAEWMKTTKIPIINTDWR